MVKALERKTKRSQDKARTARSNSQQHSSQRSTRRREKITLPEQNENNQEVLIYCTAAVYADKTPHWWDILVAKLHHLLNRQRTSIFRGALLR